MSRLTKRKKDRYGNEYIATCGGAYFEEESVYKALEKLAHYEDLEEQGRLIEQKYGYWKLEEEPNGKPYCLHCSVCDDDFHHIGITTAYNYCPNCGAKMLKGTEE